MPVILFVRITSGLDVHELERRLLERRPRFRDVPGLLQKVYGRDGATGDVCGVYFFESQEALDAFRETELARTIPAAYEAVEVRREVYEVLYSLRHWTRSAARIRFVLEHGGGPIQARQLHTTGVVRDQPSYQGFLTSGPPHLPRSLL